MEIDCIYSALARKIGSELDDGGGAKLSADLVILREHRIETTLGVSSSTTAARGELLFYDACQRE
jgi:hypothetical protein